MQKKKSIFTMLMIVVVFLIGLSLVLYPSVSNYWNSMHQAKAISSYVESVAAISDEEYQALWQATSGASQNRMARRRPGFSSCPVRNVHRVLIQQRRGRKAFWLFGGSPWNRNVLFMKMTSPGFGELMVPKSGEICRICGFYWL